MKAFGMLSNKILRVVAGHFSEIKNMTSSQLSLYTVIYCSQEMQRAISINPSGKNNLEKLEFILIKNLETFNSHEFATICNVISNNSIVFDQFL